MMITGSTVAQVKGMRRLLITAALLLIATSASADQARQRWPDSSSQDGGGEAGPRTAQPREAPRESPPPQPSAEPARPAGARVREAPPQPRQQPVRPAGPAARQADPADSPRAAEPRQRWPDNRPSTAAVPRSSVPAPQRPSGGGTTIYRPGPRVYNNYYNYPYYYPRRSYPYGYGSFGLGYFYYDPFTWYPYDYSYQFRGYGYGYPTGELRLQVRPRDAEVYVDGYYAGRVDDFDGMVQALRLEEGPYSIELVAPGYEPLIFNVRILPGQKVTYRGDLRPLRP